MAEIAPPHIESIADTGTGTPEQPAEKSRVKTPPEAKTAPPKAPAIGNPEEQEKHNLDEMA